MATWLENTEEFMAPNHKKNLRLSDIVNSCCESMFQPEKSRLEQELGNLLKENNLKYDHNIDLPRIEPVTGYIVYTNGNHIKTSQMYSTTLSGRASKLFDPEFMEPVQKRLKELDDIDTLWNQCNYHILALLKAAPIENEQNMRNQIPDCLVLVNDSKHNVFKLPRTDKMVFSTSALEMQHERMLPTLEYYCGLKLLT
jgi:hypothetical protein